MDVAKAHFVASYLRDLSRAWTSGCRSKSAGTVQMERPTQRRVCRGSPVGSWRASGALLPGSSARACCQAHSGHNAVIMHQPEEDILQECAQSQSQSLTAAPGVPVIPQQTAIIPHDMICTAKWHVGCQPAASSENERMTCSASPCQEDASQSWGLCLYIPAWTAACSSSKCFRTSL